MIIEYQKKRRLNQNYIFEQLSSTINEIHDFLRKKEEPTFTLQIYLNNSCDNMDKAVLLI